MRAVAISAIPPTDTPDLSQVTDMSRMFRDAAVFNGDIGDWDVINVTNMREMFAGATAFNQNIGGWTVSNVTDMNRMFFFASRFNQNIGDWDVSNVTDMNRMFFNATTFNQDISRWDVSKVDDMDTMLVGVTLSTDNYDALLVGWSMLTLRPGVNFDAGNNKYCNQPARNVLTDPSSNNWDIDDGGPADNCPLVFERGIPDQSYNVNTFVSVILPLAFGGTAPLEYTLTETSLLGLTFTTANRTLAGTPTTEAPTVTLTYTVTDSATPTPATNTLTFTVTINKREQTGFVFTDTTVNKIIGEDSSTFTITVTDGSGSGAVTYKSSKPAVATVDPDSGEVTIVAIGETTITATKAGDDNYNLATASYTLIVTPAALLFRIKAFLEGAQ